MDGENNGSKPYEQMDDLGGFSIIGGNPSTPPFQPQISTLSTLPFHPTLPIIKPNPSTTHMVMNIFVSQIFSPGNQGCWRIPEVAEVGEGGMDDTTVVEVALCYCWWFRNPVLHQPGMVLKLCKYWDKLQTSTSATFLNHQQ